MSSKSHQNDSVMRSKRFGEGIRKHLRNLFKICFNSGRKSDKKEEKDKMMLSGVSLGSIKAKHNALLSHVSGSEYRNIPVTAYMPVDDINADEYNFGHEERGYALIFNHDNYDSKLRMEPRRSGSKQDIESLEKTLKMLEFSVKVFNNYTKAEIDKELSRVSQVDHSLYDCFLLVCLTHGEQGDYLYAFDKAYEAKDLWLPFLNNACLTLANKPKLFFFQACRGSLVDEGMDMTLPDGEDRNVPTIPGMTLQEKENCNIPSISDVASHEDKDCNIPKMSDTTLDEVEKCNIPMTSDITSHEFQEYTNIPIVSEMISHEDEEYNVPMTSDMTSHEVKEYIIPKMSDLLVMYATPHGYVAWRAPDGSPFIQSLCEQLNMSAFEDDLLSILTAVKREVGINYRSNCEGDEALDLKKTMPVIAIDTLMRKIKFSPKTGNC